MVGHDVKAAPPAKKPVVQSAIVAAFALLSASAVDAGGYDTGERNWDLMFQTDNMALQLGVGQARPKRVLRDINGTLGPSANTPEAASLRFTSLRFAFRVNDSLRCMLGTHQPYGGRAEYDPAWTYAASAVMQDFSSRSVDFTCAQGFNLGDGQLSFVLGVSHQEIRYQLHQDFTLLNPLLGMARTDVKDSAVTWRAGLAYELPEYALRASLIFNSGASLRPSGTFSNNLATIPIEGRLRTPPSIELGLQSGVADRTLAFLRLSRTFWSKTADMPLCPAGLPTCTMANAVSGLTLDWRDTNRITLGVARQVSDTITVTAAFTHDQGATRGFTSQSTVQSIALGGVFQVGPNVDFNLSAFMGRMKGGVVNTTILPSGAVNPLGYTATYGRDRVAGISSALTLRF